MLCLHFLLPRYFLFPFWFPFWPTGCARLCCQSPLICDFSKFPLIIGFFSNCGQKKNLIWAQSSKICRLFLWSTIWSVLENDLHVLEKNVYSSAVGWNILYVSLKFFGIKYNSSNLFPCWFSVWLSYLFLKMGYSNPLLLLFCYILFPSDILVFAYHIWVNTEYIFFKTVISSWWIYAFFTM